MADADIELKTHDTRPYLDCVLKDVSGAINLTGAAVRFHMQDSDGNIVVNQSTTTASPKVSIEDSTAGEVRYKWAAADTSTAGHFEAEWQITFGDGSKVSVPNDGHLSVVIYDDIVA
jgi:hypothetical protein